jgi:archaellum component FlaC
LTKEKLEKIEKIENDIKILKSKVEKKIAEKSPERNSFRESNSSPSSLISKFSSSIIP